MKVAVLLGWLGLALLEVSAAGWTDGPGHRHAALAPRNGSRNGFRRLPATETGLGATNLLSEVAIAANRVLANGAGLAVGDFDGDALPDLFVCGLESPSRLFRNLGGWRFREVTAEAGLPPALGRTRGAVFADLDGDGHDDLLVSTALEGVRCFRNVGGRFAETTVEAGLRGDSGSSTLALADVDGNGTLDLYVANYRTNDIRDVGRLSVRNVGGKPVIPPALQGRFRMRGDEVAECGEADRLYLNDGRGRFTLVSWTDGSFLDADGRPLREAPLDWGLTATFRDVDGNGSPDLYVCNDYWTPDRFWLNDGRGRFRAAAPFTLRRIPSSSMGVDFADIDRDGWFDFLVVEMLASDLRTRKRQSLADAPEWPPVGADAGTPQVFQNTLFTARGDGSYAEIAQYAGLAATDWSWSPMFLDVDLDGFEDLLVTSGHFRDVQDLDAQMEIRRRQHPWSGYATEASRQAAFTRELAEHYGLYPGLALPLRSFRNGGDRRFHETTAEWGLTNAAVRHGMALADLDGDGDLDLVVNCLNSPLEVYRNEAPGARVAVRLKGLSPNRAGIGARVLLHEGGRTQSKEIIAGGSYLSGSQPMAVFGTSSMASLEVRWRSGRISWVTNVVPDRLYELNEPDRPPAVPPAVSRPPALFTDVGDRLGHTHQEPAFDDYQRQPLLPFVLSQQGPGLAWFDLDGDGNDDLVIGSGSGGTPSVFHSDGRGGFSPGTSTPDLAAPGDLLGLVGWRDATLRPRLLAAVSGYEQPQKAPLAVLGSTGRSLGRLGTCDLPPSLSSASTLAIGCLAPPAGLVLFVGGGVDPGRYPFARTAALLRLDASAGWKHDAAASARLADVGLVNGALWSDLDGDAVPELVLACDWGPVRVFASRTDGLVETTSEMGLADLTGLWRGIASADLDGDGRMDLVAGNWGWNSAWSAGVDRPFTALVGETSRPGTVDFLETAPDPVTGKPTPLRSLERLGAALPFVPTHFRSFKAFSEAPIDAVLGEWKVLVRPRTVRTLASSVFLNRGGRFVASTLPAEAQFAPASSVNVADFDGDGHPDLFLGQNLTGIHPDAVRQDAGLGLLLRGDGRGGFRPVGSADSGLRIQGDQRGAAVCDFDGDGRPDLAVGQNGAATRLFRNSGGTPGLRVRLVGPPGNPDAIGAQFWLESGAARTPTLEVQAGSGWLSQDSAVKVVPRLAQATLKVRWPGGRSTSVAVPATGAEVRLASGELSP